MSLLFNTRAITRAGKLANILRWLLTSAKVAVFTGCTLSSCSVKKWALPNFSILRAEADQPRCGPRHLLRNDMLKAIVEKYYCPGSF